MRAIQRASGARCKTAPVELFRRVLRPAERPEWVIEGRHLPWAPQQRQRFAWSELEERRDLVATPLSHDLGQVVTTRTGYHVRVWSERRLRCSVPAAKQQGANVAIP